MPTIKKLLRNIITATNLVEKIWPRSSLFVLALSLAKVCENKPCISEY